MREDYQRERTSALTWLIAAILAGFVLQLLVDSPLIRGGTRFSELMGLSTEGLRSGWVWTLLTHAFLHSTDFIVHVVVNVLVLYFLGRELLPMLGTRRFLGLFAAATIVGGIFWATTHWQDEGQLQIGASAAIDALLIVFACFFPNQQLSFLLFFLIPVTLRPKHLAFGITGAAIIGFFCYEFPGHSLPFEISIASSAHLGGILTGYFYYRFIHDGRRFISGGHTETGLPRWIKRTRKPERKSANVAALPPVPSTRDEIRVEVDRILDKINSDGFGALTAEEKRVLDDAKDLLSRR